MPVVSFQAFKTEIYPTFSRKTRLMGLDLGRKRIGISLSDLTHSIASPFKLLERKTFQGVACELINIIDLEDVGALIVGLPLEMNGKEGRSTQSVRHFVYNLLQLRECVVVFWDERFSTAAVTRTLLEADISRKKRAQVVDKMAASYILQGFLDALA